MIYSTLLLLLGSFLNTGLAYANPADTKKTAAAARQAECKSVGDRKADEVEKACLQAKQGSQEICADKGDSAGLDALADCIQRQRPVEQNPAPNVKQDQKKN